MEICLKVCLCECGFVWYVYMYVRENVDKFVKNTGRMVVYNNKMLYHLDELHPHHSSNLLSHAWMRSIAVDCDFADRRHRNAIFFKSQLRFFPLLFLSPAFHLCLSSPLFMVFFPIRKIESFFILTKTY